MVDRTPRQLTARSFLLHWLPAVLWAALIFCLSSQSEPPQPATVSRVPGWSSIAHFGLYFVLGALLYRALQGRDSTPLSDTSKRAGLVIIPFAYAVVAGALYGATDEVHQYFVPERQTDIFDWLVDVCGTMATKNVNCWDVTWEQCGSNTYPAGSFPGCVSSFGAYDMLGNVAEHMNLPLSAEQLASSTGLGQTEMKGSWFAFDGLVPYPDDCRWRAPAWHDTPIDSPSSHRNYQLGFRCCKDLL